MTLAGYARRGQQLQAWPWALWLLQARRVIRIEVRRNMLSWRAAWIYFLAFVPTVLLFIRLLVMHRPGFSMNEDTNVIAGIIQFYYIRLAIFFGCLGIFSRLIRGEMLQRSLHFYLLAPVNREVLLLAKFVAGAAGAVMLFVSAVVLDFLFIFLPYGSSGQDFVFNGPGLGQLQAYVTVTILACLGYGAVFLLLSMIFRNPTPAAMLFFGWEFINPVMPSLLQKLSVASYLRHLMPIHVPGQGIFALLTVQTEPVSGWAAGLGLLVLVAVVLAYSCIRIRRLEIRYTTE